MKNLNQTLKLDLSQEYPLEELSPEKLVSGNINLLEEYWTPSSIGETKLLVFRGICEEETVPDYQDLSQMQEMPVAHFVELLENGMTLIKTAAIRLVSWARANMEVGEVYRVVFTGSFPNKYNEYSSFYFQVFAIDLNEETKIENQNAN